MESLHIRGTEDSPEIYLDPASKQFVISGKSLPEDVSSFYAPVLEWLENYSSQALDSTLFNIRLTYFNTASSKLLLDIFLILEEIRNKGKEVVIRWHYPEYDEDLKDAGIEYSEMVELDFEYILDPLR